MEGDSTRDSTNLDLSKVTVGALNPNLSKVVGDILEIGLYIK